MDREDIVQSLRNAIDKQKALLKELKKIVAQRVVTKKQIRHKYKDVILEKMKIWNIESGYNNCVMFLYGIKQEIKELQRQLNDYDRRSKTQNT